MNVYIVVDELTGEPIKAFDSLRAAQYYVNSMSSQQCKLKLYNLVVC